MITKTLLGVSYYNYSLNERPQNFQNPLLFLKAPILYPYSTPLKEPY